MMPSPHALACEKSEHVGHHRLIMIARCDVAILIDTARQQTPIVLGHAPPQSTAYDEHAVHLKQKVLVVE
jgi:hypothetical protein